MFAFHKTKHLGQKQGRAGLRSGLLAPSPRCSAFSFDLEKSYYTANDVIVLEVEVKGSAEPFQILLEPYALIIPGENYIGLNVKKDFRVGPCHRQCCPGAAVRGRWREKRTVAASHLTEDGCRGPGTHWVLHGCWAGRACPCTSFPASSKRQGWGAPSCVHGSLAGPGAHKPCGVGLVLLD